jgi:hypothetical protein
MTAFTDKVVTVCGEELALFEGGALKEYDKAVFQRVGKYWDELAKIPDYKAWEGLQRPFRREAGTEVERRSQKDHP